MPWTLQVNMRLPFLMSLSSYLGCLVINFRLILNACVFFGHPKVDWAFNWAPNLEIWTRKKLSRGNWKLVGAWNNCLGLLDDCIRSRTRCYSCRRICGLQNQFAFFASAEHIFPRNSFSALVKSQNNAEINWMKFTCFAFSTFNSLLLYFFLIFIFYSLSLKTNLKPPRQIRLAP